jgi:hypothetical protein
MKHYRFYTTKTKVRKKWYARALALIEIKKGLMELLGIELRNEITLQGRGPYAGESIGGRDSIEQALGRNGIHGFYSWGYPHLATDNEKAIAYIEAHLPEWSRILKRPNKYITHGLRQRDYENYSYM